MSAFGGKADINVKGLSLPLMTHMRHWPAYFDVTHNTALMHRCGGVWSSAPKRSASDINTAAVDSLKSA